MTETILLRTRKAQTDALNRALDSLESAAEDPETLSQEVRWLMEDCVRTSGRLKMAFDRGQKQWTPRPVEDIHEFYAELLGIVDGQARFAGRVRDRALKIAEATGETFDFKPLDESVQSLRNLRENIDRLCEWLASPVPVPGGPYRSAAERRAAFERGEYEAVEDVVNRVRQGGPVHKE
jgi:hypothetical protein